MSNEQQFKITVLENLLIEARREIGDMFQLLSDLMNNKNSFYSTSSIPTAVENKLNELVSRLSILDNVFVSVSDLNNTLNGVVESQMAMHNLLKSLNLDKLIDLGTSIALLDNRISQFFNKQEDTNIMADHKLADVLAEIKEIRNAEEAQKSFISSLQDQLSQAKNDPAQITEIVNALDDVKANLWTNVNANTPSAPVDETPPAPPVTTPPAPPVDSTTTPPNDSTVTPPNDSTVTQDPSQLGNTVSEVAGGTPAAPGDNTGPQ